MNKGFDPFSILKQAIITLLGFFILFGAFTVLLVRKLGVRQRDIQFPGTSDSRDVTNQQKRYQRTAGVLTKTEMEFYLVLAQAVYPELVVFPKMRITDLINPVEHRRSSNGATAWNQIAQKHVDFVLCHSASLQVAGVVELDDRSHDRADRRARDQLVDQAFNDADMRVLHVQCQPSYSRPDTRRIILQELGIPTI